MEPENDGWKMSLLLGRPIFRFHVKFRGSTQDHLNFKKKTWRKHKHGIEECGSTNEFFDKVL